MMLEINDFQERLEREFGDGVKVSSFNVYYDDTEEVASLVDRVWRERLRLPVTFVDEELVLEGLIDKDAIGSIMTNCSK
jgi:disulfide oxidoreductase YuzD